MPGRLGILLVASGAAFGALATVLTHSEPDTVLGGFVVAATLAAALAVRRRAVYLIIPVPALAYMVAAAMAGLVHDRATDTSRTALAVSAAQWAASGFVAMIIATLLAIAITAARWPWGQAPRSHRRWQRPGGRQMVETQARTGRVRRQELDPGPAD